MCVYLHPSPPILCVCVCVCVSAELIVEHTHVWMLQRKWHLGELL